MRSRILFLLGIGMIIGMSTVGISCGGGDEFFEPFFCESDFDCPDGQICSVNNNCIDPF